MKKKLSEILLFELRLTFYSYLQINIGILQIYWKCNKLYLIGFDFGIKRHVLIQLHFLFKRFSFTIPINK